MTILLHQETEPSQWWREAVIYQIYPRSFASANGPIGDLRGVIGKLGYLRDLGVDALWLSPFYLSPQKDAGYDVADYRQVDPMFGANDDAARLIEKAHEHGLKLIVDLVPNHTSDQHEWFQAALRDPQAPERELYWFRGGKDAPPNDWASIFGGAAWTRVYDRPDAPGSPWENDQQWYLHLFDASQPDLNWDNPKVRKEFRSILRHWLDLGVDGFRVDVAHGMAKDPELPDWQFHYDMVSGAADADIPPPPQWNRPEVHGIYREWHMVLGEYGPDRALVAEAWVDDINDLAKYVRSDEMHQAFNFDFLIAPYTADSYRTTIRDSLAAMDSVGAPTTWVLSNHDVVRAVSRFGLAETGKGPNGIRATDEQPDPDVGFNRALAAHTLQAALPGSCYIYQGEELGLPEHTALPDELRQDPAFFRTQGEEAGRDGCRIPMPWQAGKPGYGFSPSGEVWLPQPAEYGELAADVQDSDPDSTLSFFRHLFAERRRLQMATAALYEAAPHADHLHYISTRGNRPDVHIIVTFDHGVELPAGARVLVESPRRGRAGRSDGALGAPVPANAAIWFTLD